MSAVNSLSVVVLELLAAAPPTQLSDYAQWSIIRRYFYLNTTSIENAGQMGNGPTQIDECESHMCLCNLIHTRSLSVCLSRDALRVGFQTFGATAKNCCVCAFKLNTMEECANEREADGKRTTMAILSKQRSNITATLCAICVYGYVKLKIVE